MSDDDLRSRLHAIAYRMLGSVSEAEDTVQEAFLRLHRARQDGTNVESERAYLTTVTTRLAIDQLRSARARRETYPGPWLPEPVLTAGQEEAAELAESLSMAFLVVLESLSPTERAVFLLREVFDCGYDEIATAVGKSEENCRQIATRARQHVESRKPRFTPSAVERDELARRFFAACAARDEAALTALLAEQATFYGDGGGKATAYPRPVVGRDHVAAVMLAIFRMVDRHGIRMEPAAINGQPGARFLDGEGRLINVMALDTDGGAIQAVRSVINPDKLQHIGPVSDLARLGHH